MCAGDTARQAINEEEESDQADLDATDDAPIQIPWTPPGSRRRRDIILPREATSKSQVKPLRNEERLKLLRAIGTARRWCDALLPVPQAGIEAIAARHGKTESWVRKHLTLAFLDPKLVEAAVDGLLPRGYGVSRFLDLPADWTDQWCVLGLPYPRDHTSRRNQQ